VIVAIAGIVLAATLSAAGLLHPALALASCLVAAALLLFEFGAQADAERLAAGLCGDAAGARRPLAEALPRIARRLAEMEHRWSARHPVTGLQTREHLFEAITSDIEAGATRRLLGAIRFVNFDRLASFDQPAANAALAQFAGRIASAAGTAHPVAQIDRDSIAIWVRDEPDAEAAVAAFRAMVYISAQEIAVGGMAMEPAIEAGTATFPFDGTDPTQLLTRAIAALARPEVTAAGEVVILAPPSIDAARERFRLEQDLAQALVGGQLSMVFQPVVDLARGRLVGAEALLRWQHPELGAISPAYFIPIVEEIGLSERYGLWVLNAACREARLWQDEGLTDMRVAVNLSARQLLDPTLRQKIERTLHRHDLAPQALELELTETAAMVDAGRTLALFGELHAMGISLAIDDFGSGYSSLSYLKNLRFDKLKIDREFVRQVQDRRDSQAICRALIELGRGLDLKVLAEGVEDEREVAMLRTLGCELFQGYHFAKPMSGAHFRRLARDPAWLATIASPVHRQRAQLEGRLSA
jgi:EAL domain-containing protein (putative c-di-GMP-specific phosphodiesterase class I)/GGDEF domain-containing protein